MYENLVKNTTSITAYIWHSRFNPDSSFLQKFDKRDRYEDSDIPFYIEIRDITEGIQDDDWNAKLMKGE